MQRFFAHRYGKRIAVFMAVLMTALFLCGPFGQIDFVQAKSVSDMQNQIDQIDQQIKDLEDQMNANKQKLEDEQAHQKELTDQILNVEQQLSLYQEKIDMVEAEITQKEEEIAAKQDEIAENEELFAARLRRMYITNTSSSALTTLLSANSFSDFLNRYEILKRISQEDRTLIETLTQQKKDLESLRESLSAQKEDLQASYDEINVKKKELDGLYAQSKNIESSILDANREYMENVEKYKDQQAALEKEIEEMLQNEGNDEAYGDGQLKWPVPSRSYISSYFGWRTLYGKPNYHTGIDIPGASGTSIVAADAGKVLSVKYLDYGYGYHVIVDHGNGVATLYGHCSRIDVVPGQMVQKGQTIAGIGTTGNSTGNHLHFEVRINGAKMNPLNYVRQPS